MRNLRSTGTWVVLTAAATLLSACAAPDANDATAQAAAAGRQLEPRASDKPLKPKEMQQALADAYAAFERKQYDAAMTGAQRVLAGNPAGKGAAEAQYLRGRVLEERAAQASGVGDSSGAKAALQSAREAYNAALAANPAPAVEGNIRAGIANVAYFQDDYATAIAEWTAAHEKITEPQTKAWVLYRVGLSQQRFGNFPDADRTFALVQQQYSGTEAARRAAAHQGARGFHVQVGVFTSPTNADATIASLRADGIIGTHITDAQGRHVVRIGPAPTYDQAKALKARLAAKFPDAVILP